MIDALLDETGMSAADFEEMLIDDYGVDIEWPREAHRIGAHLASEIIYGLKLRKHTGRKT